MGSFASIYHSTNLRDLRHGLVEALKAGDNERANAYAWQAASVARANREGRPIGRGVDLDFDAEHRRALATIAEEESEGKPDWAAAPEIRPFWDPTPDLRFTR